MIELNEIQSYIVDDYVFETKPDYEDALQEKKGIKYLSSQLDLNNTERTYQLYTELIEKKIFRTPIGMDYLVQLRKAILKSDKYAANQLLPIPVSTSGHREKERVEKYVSTKYEATLKNISNENKKNKTKLRSAIILNIVFAIIIVAMFFITSNSSSPNILNYERVIQDKYASWEARLKEKEQEIKDKEWKLKQQEDKNSQK